MTTPAPRGCRLLEWDTAFFQKRIARLDPEALGSRVLPAVEAWLESDRIECGYLLLDAVDRAANEAAVARGFRLVDQRVTLEALVTPAAPAAPGPFRPAQERDIPALCSIARASHHDTRFYADGRFPRERCDDLYEEWVRQSCRGWADHVLVADQAGVPVGYVTCHLRADRGEIGLVGVQASSRGQGVATAMLPEALAWFGRQGRARVSVATQGRNAAALRLYEAAGFAVVSTGFWYHRWLDEPLTR